MLNQKRPGEKEVSSIDRRKEVSGMRGNVKLSSKFFSSTDGERRKLEMKWRSKILLKVNGYYQSSHIVF